MSIIYETPVLTIAERRDCDTAYGTWQKPDAEVDDREEFTEFVCAHFVTENFTHRRNDRISLVFSTEPTANPEEVAVVCVFGCYHRRLRMVWVYADELSQEPKTMFPALSQALYKALQPLPEFRSGVYAPAKICGLYSDKPLTAYKPNVKLWVNLRIHSEA